METEAEASEPVAVVAAETAAEEVMIEETIDEGVALATEETAAEEAMIQETHIEGQTETIVEESMAGEAAVDHEASDALVLVSDEPDSLVLVGEAPDSEEEVAQPPASEDASPEVTGAEKKDESDPDGDDERE
jgi:hypothetical protein